MPSASAKIEKVASSEATDPIKQIVTMLEKRIRNLEKRKTKLDNYRNDVKNGKELNEDQKIAVSKYDVVEGLLEFTREFNKSMNTMLLESARQQKKQAKKEQIERQQHEIHRLQEAFFYRHILSSLQNEEVRADFLSGENDALQLTNEQLLQLDQLYKLMERELPSEKADLSNHFHVLAENHIFLVEGKNKEIVGTTYKVLKELLHNVKESGYFTRSTQVAEEESVNDIQEQEVVENVEAVKDDQTAQEQVPPKINEEPEPSVTATNADVPKKTLVTNCTLQNGPLQEVLSGQGSFNFLQESQIDLDAPHMDPAVVAVHQIAPPPAVNFTSNSYSTSPQAKEASKPAVNGIKPADHPQPSAATPQPQTTQQSTTPVVSAAAAPRTVTPVLTSVRHGAQRDFDPSHPIPTQTFTNQSFAVMQNMIMPQAYVPVTMHHGPIPPHMTPIAVVPGLSPPVTSAPACVVPIDIPVTTVQMANVAVVDAPNAEEAKVKDGETQDSVAGKDGALDAENGSTNAKDKNGNNDGYTTYRSGFRGRGRSRGNNGYYRGRSNYSGRGGYQNHYYQDRNNYNNDRNNYNNDRSNYNNDRSNYNDRNNYNNNYRRGNNRGGPRGNGRGRGGNNYRPSQQQQQQQTQQTQE